VTEHGPQVSLGISVWVVPPVNCFAYVTNPVGGGPRESSWPSCVSRLGVRPRRRVGLTDAPELRLVAAGVRVDGLDLLTVGRLHRRGVGVRFQAEHCERRPHRVADARADEPVLDVEGEAPAQVRPGHLQFTEDDVGVVGAEAEEHLRVERDGHVVVREVEGDGDVAEGVVLDEPLLDGVEERPNLLASAPGAVDPVGRRARRRGEEALAGDEDAGDDDGGDDAERQPCEEPGGQAGERLQKHDCVFVFHTLQYLSRGGPAGVGVRVTSTRTSIVSPGQREAMTTYDIERYLNIRSAYGGSFSPDGELLAFLMNTTGTPQVWTVDGAGRWPVQRTFYDDRVTFVDHSPERHELVFGKDQGGDERAQLFRLDTETGAITNLTQRPGAKHRWGGWSADGERFAFASNRRDESVFDVYVQGREETGGDAELVYEGDGWLSLAGWSPDDSQLLVHEAHSSYDHDVHVLDIASGGLRHVTPHDGDVRYQSVEWAPDGESLYLVTDRDADTLRLERLDLETEGHTVVEDGGEWNVDGISIDEASGRVAFSRNVDGYTELTVGEFDGPDSITAFETPDLPDGIAGGVDFTADGERFAVTATASADNANVYVVDAVSGESERWTYAATAGIPRDTFVAPQLVHFPTFDGRDIPAYFSVPEAIEEGEAVDEQVPVIVDIHGGPESQRRPSFSTVKQYLLNNGYAVFEPNVRGSSGYGREYASLDDVRNRMDSVKDLKAGVEWLHDHPSVDSEKIVAYGGSYGGFMVLAALTEYPDLWAAGIDVVGIANFVTFLENTGEWRRSLREAEYGSLEEDREFLEEISPINNIERIRAPLFVLHGENDPRVPVGEAEQIVENAREQGVPVRKLVFPDEGHGFSKLENRIEAYSQIVEFLDEHL
jgi:dipeptidyl aminopeptidase/acylaminoacyl peptidase